MSEELTKNEKYYFDSGFKEGAKQERDRIEKEIDNTDFTTDTEKEREGLKLYLKNKIKNQRGRENEEDMERENKSCLF